MNKMADDKKEKMKALQMTLDKLDKAYGKGTIMKLGDTAIEAIDVISTGSLGLDIALGIGVEVTGSDNLPRIIARAEKRLPGDRAAVHKPDCRNAAAMAPKDVAFAVAVEVTGTDNRP